VKVAYPSLFVEEVASSWTKQASAAALILVEECLQHFPIFTLQQCSYHIITNINHLLVNHQPFITTLALIHNQWLEVSKAKRQNTLPSYKLPLSSHLGTWVSKTVPSYNRPQLHKIQPATKNVSLGVNCLLICISAILLPKLPAKTPKILVRHIWNPKFYYN